MVQVSEESIKLAKDRLVSLLPDVYSNYQRAFSGIAPNPGHVRNISENALDPNRSLEQLANVERMAGMSLAGKKILEVGCGLGLSVALARLWFQSEAFGIEPASDFYHGERSVSVRLFENLSLDPDALKTGNGEALPYEDGLFDLVYSNNVLEHVQDPAQVISECLRVLKPGGLLCIVVPNYGSWWEGHYGIFILPHSPKWLIKLEAKVLGRDPAFVDTLQMITYGRLRRWLSAHRDAAEVLTFGQDVWIRRIRTLEFSEWASLARIKHALRIVRRLRLIEPLILASRVFHWETPFNLVVRKKGAGGK